MDNNNKGMYGPNDYGYIHNIVVECATLIKKAQDLYSEGHYAHSDAKLIPATHPLRLVMEQLAKLDQMYAQYANKQPNPELFSTYIPSLIAQTRFSNYKPGLLGFPTDNHTIAINLKVFGAHSSDIRKLYPNKLKVVNEIEEHISNAIRNHWINTNDEIMDAIRSYIL